MAKITVMSVSKEINSVADLYDSVKRKVEKNRFNKKLDVEQVQRLFAMLDEEIDELRSLVPSGKEDIEALAEDVRKVIKNVDKALDGEFLSTLSNHVDDLNYRLDTLIEGVRTGHVVYPDPISQASSVRQKLMQQYEATKEISDRYLSLRNQKEEEIRRVEAEMEEIKDKLCDEENERLITQLYAVYNAKQREVNEKEIYSKRLLDCHTILASILESAKFVLDTASDKSEAMGRAQAYLDVKKYQDMVTNPEKAFVVLKMIDEQLGKLRKDLVPAVVDKQASALSEEARIFREKARAEREAKQLAGKVKSLDNLEEKKEEQQDSTVVNK